MSDEDAAVEQGGDFLLDKLEGFGSGGGVGGVQVPRGDAGPGGAVVGDVDVGRGEDVGVVEGLELVGDEGDAGEEGVFGGGGAALGDGERGQGGGADHFAVEGYVFLGLGGWLWRVVGDLGWKVLGGGVLL